MQAVSTQEESLRMTAVRKVYQRAIVTPTHHIEQLWREYENFENSVSRQLVTFWFSMCSWTDAFVLIDVCYVFILWRSLFAGEGADIWISTQIQQCPGCLQGEEEICWWNWLEHTCCTSCWLLQGKFLHFISDIISDDWLYCLI